MGPPTAKRPPMEQHATDDSNSQALSFQSNLIEPISSTLISSPQQNTNQDSSPFTPIELLTPAASSSMQANGVANLVSQQQQQQRHPFLRPSPLVESMLTSYTSPFKPEPPVQVASYLAQHFAAQVQANSQQQQQQQQQPPPLVVSSERSVASNRPVTLSVTLPALEDNYQAQLLAPAATSQQESGRAMNSSSSRPVDLILLKPAPIEQRQQLLLANKSTQQAGERISHQSPTTYMLKPEFLSLGSPNYLFSHHGASNPFRPMESNRLLDSAGAAAAETSGAEPASRRLAGQLFDRLSSLSSPPSTSMVLDPMQASNSMTSLLLNKPHNSAGRQQESSAKSNSDFLAPTTLEAQQIVADEQQQATSRHNYSDEAQLLRNVLSGASSPPKVGISAEERVSDKPWLTTGGNGKAEEGGRRNSLVGQSGPDADSNNSNHFNLLFKDNNTDNAILSHVMSLISSNAIPAPPMVPTIQYSSADSFSPIRGPLVRRR